MTYKEQDSHKVNQFKSMITDLTKDDDYQIVHIDETGFDKKLQQTHGRSERGIKAIDKHYGSCTDWA